MGDRKLRVLCVHGYGQAGSSLRSKSGGLRSESKRLCEWTFVDAPHVLSDADESLEAAEHGRTWWRWRSGPLGAKEYDRESLESSFEALRVVCETDGPFDGLLGFSQGACLVAMLACRQEQGTLPACMRFRFAALFSGFLPHDPTLARPMLEAKPATIASFHCFGAQDSIISREQSVEAMGLFEPARCCSVEHESGHLVPSSKFVRTAFRDFLSRQLDMPASLN